MNFKSNNQIHNIKFAFILTISLMLICHGFSFVNLMYSHDSLNLSYDAMYKVTLGRFLYQYFILVRGAPYIPNPYLIGIISTFFVSLTVVFLTKIFFLNKFQIAIVSIVCSTNVSLISLFATYIHDSDVDTFALFLSTFAVYVVSDLFTNKNESVKKLIFKTFISVLLLICVLALYQTYFCVTLCLFILILLKDATYANCKDKLFNWIKKTFIYLMIAVISFFFYIICMKLFIYLINGNLENAYNGPQKLDGITLSTIIKSIPEIYFKYFHIFIDQTNVKLAYYFNKLILILILAEYLLICIFNSNKIILIILMTLLISVFPIASIVFYAVSDGMIHDLMTYSVNLTYLIPIILYRNLNIKFSSKIIVNSYKYVSYMYLFLILIIGWIQCFYANNIYQYKKIIYDNTLLHAQTIWKDINQINDYQEGKTSVMFIGNLNDSKLAFKNTTKVVKNFYTGYSTSSITYDETVRHFFNLVLGRELILEDYSQNLISNSTFDILRSMPSYPKNGYIRFIEGKVYIKLSDSEKL